MGAAGHEGPRTPKTGTQNGRRNKVHRLCSVSGSGALEEREHTVHLPQWGLDRKMVPPLLHRKEGAEVAKGKKKKKKSSYNDTKTSK